MEQEGRREVLCRGWDLGKKKQGRPKPPKKRGFSSQVIFGVKGSGVRNALPDDGKKKPQPRGMELVGGSAQKVRARGFPATKESRENTPSA